MERAWDIVVMEYFTRVSQHLSQGTEKITDICWIVVSMRDSPFYVLQILTLT
jgi:HJR/Mrr/RecB family endonuclease